MANMIGVSNVAQEIGKGWIGGANGIAQEIAAGWIGDASNKAQLFFKGGVEAGEVVFTESTVWTVPEGVSNVEIFCVGGGGGAGGGSYDYRETSDYNWYERFVNGGAGGGGYTATALNVGVASGEKLTVAVGAGGSQGKYWYRKYPYGGSATQHGTASSNSGITDGSAGGISSVVNSAGTVLCSANGGAGGSKANSTQSNTTSANGGAGGSGGTSGTGRYWSYYNNAYDYYREWVGNNANPPQDGANGNGTRYYATQGATTYKEQNYGGAGQGTTTRYFGESGGTLYANGGHQPTSCSRTDIASQQMANTGNGGGFTSAFNPASGYDGSSGIVIIRWAAQ